MWLVDISVRRPVLASVFAVLLVVAGIISLRDLSVREYPDVSSPIVSVRVTYPGASSAIIDTQVTEIIEGAVSGVEGIRSITSRSNNGSSRVNIEFTLSRDIDEAANDVRDRVSRVIDELPEGVEPPRVQKQDSDARPVVYINVSDPSRNSMELIDYSERYLAERFSAIPGVSSVDTFGSGRPSMRIWIDRIALAARNLTVADVDAALRRENVEFPAGMLEGADREFPVRVARGYATVEDFRGLVLAEGPDNHLIRLGEVARVELGPRNPRRVFRANGQPSSAIGVFKQSTANTVEVLDGVNQVIAEINASSDTLSVVKSDDDSIFIRAAVNTVYQTILLTTVLVGLVIFLFLTQWRATLVPVVTIPICLVATFAAMALAGFSINLITLLALVLCIGLVVDDAIVVLENVYRRIQKGEPALLAAKRGASQVVFAVIATTAVLVAVFVPITFLTDNVGRLFGELALTLCAALILSSVLALTLVPMLASKLLRGHGAELRRSNVIVRFIEHLSATYSALLARALEARYAWLLVAVLTGVGAWFGFQSLDREYVPDEDRGSLAGVFRGPEGSSREFMLESLQRLESPAVELVNAGELNRALLVIPGFGGGTSSNAGFVSMTLAPWGERELTTAEAVKRLNREWSQIEDLRVFTFTRSPIRGGDRPIEFVIGGTSYEQLADWRDRVLARARENPGLTRLDSDLIETQPQMIVDVDTDRAAALGVPVQQIGRELQLLMSDQTSTRFQSDGEEYDVVIQADDRFRRSVADLQHVYVRSSASSELIPLANVVSVRELAEPAALNRFNRLRSVTITADLNDGYALGEALDYLRDVAMEELPATAQLGYKGGSREYVEAGNSLLFTFCLALAIVYLVLAAQFESFIQPLIIMCTVPLALAGGFLGLLLTDTSLNIYSQIGLLMLIGIATKNGVLIVEFINQIRDAGTDLKEGIVKASTMRFRPVIMTAASTIMGSIPLVLATGPGSEGLSSVGVVILWGVLVATVLTLFIVPVLYSFIGTLSGSPGEIGHELDRLEEAATQR
ncbi:MAG: efflux RND transporter permease subunit [Pseudomonadota bacterium]